MPTRYGTVLDFLSGTIQLNYYFLQDYLWFILHSSYDIKKIVSFIDENGRPQVQIAPFFKPRSPQDFQHKVWSYV
jgi:hypothetical protein